MAMEWFPTVKQRQEQQVLLSHQAGVEAFAAVGAEAHSRGKLLAGCLHGADGSEEEGGSLAVVDLATGTLVSKAILPISLQSLQAWKSQLL